MYKKKPYIKAILISFVFLVVILSAISYILFYKNNAKQTSSINDLIISEYDESSDAELGNNTNDEIEPNEIAVQTNILSEQSTSNSNSTTNITKTSSASNSTNLLENITAEATIKTPSCNHDSGLWFNSKEEAVAHYNEKLKEYHDDLNSGRIDYDEYLELCPNRYERISCPYCGKWLLTMFYR